MSLRPQVSYLKMLAWASSTDPESLSQTNGTTLYNSTKKYSPKCGINNHNGLSQIEFQVELTTD